MSNFQKIIFENLDLPLPTNTMVEKGGARLPSLWPPPLRPVVPTTMELVIAHTRSLYGFILFEPMPYYQPLDKVIPISIFIHSIISVGVPLFKQGLNIIGCLVVG